MGVLRSPNKAIFFIFLLRNEKVILHIGNVGANRIITLMFYNQGQLPVNELEQLAAEIKNELESRFNLEFCVADPDTSECNQ